MMHWAFNYLGKAWQSGAQGPDAYDCWGLVRAINKMHFGRELPLIVVDATNPDTILKTFYGHPEFNNWRLVDDPQEGDCVITKSKPDSPQHIGIYINVGCGRVLQSVYGSGVVAISVEATKRLIGQHIEFWRWAK